MSDDIDVDLGDVYPEVLKQNLVQSVANVMESENSTTYAFATGGPHESLKLCVIASLIPNQSHNHYMKKMLALHKKLIKQYPQLVSTRPEKTH